jgi:hypothetical protein
MDLVVIGRALNDSAGFDKESLNRSMKMMAPWGLIQPSNGGKGIF